MSSVDTYSAGWNGGAVKRIRTPHNHDVLSGRGGSINSHVGNIQFREWVRVRKNDYNLAASKAEKAKVAKEVIELVRSQDPPGRFLQKDPTSGGTQGWWVELDEDRIMAKTSQALREGAPLIRAAHQTDFQQPQRTKSGRRSRKTKPTSPTPEKTPATKTATKRTHPEMETTKWTNHPNVNNSNSQFWMQQKAIEELHANVEAAKHAKEEEQSEEEYEFKPPEKRVRVDYQGHLLRPDEETPPLSSLPHEDHLVPPPLDLSTIPHPQKSSDSEGIERAHSLALSDVSTSEWVSEDFVNPFEDESHLHASSTSKLLSELNGRKPSSESLGLGSPRPGVLRETSTVKDSNGDMGGIGALVRTDSSKNSSQGSGVRSRNSLQNTSSRYDQADPSWDEGHDITPLDLWWDVENGATPVSP